MSANPKAFLPKAELEPCASANLAAPLSDERRENILIRLEAWIEEEENLIAEVEKRVGKRFASLDIFDSKL
jgi:hypothetical protein